MKRLFVLAILAACAPRRPYRYGYVIEGAAERQLPATATEVVSRARANELRGEGRIVQIPTMAGADHAALIAELLAHAEDEGGGKMASIAIVERVRRDGADLECRSEIVVETLVSPAEPGTKAAPEENAVDCTGDGPYRNCTSAPSGTIGSMSDTAPPPAPRAPEPNRRRRLRELKPICVAAGEETRGSRIEGRLYPR